MKRLFNFVIVITFLLHVDCSLQEEHDTAAIISDLTKRLENLEKLRTEDAVKSRLREEELLSRLKVVENNEKRIFDLERLYTNQSKEWDSLKHLFELAGITSFPAEGFHRQSRTTALPLAAFYAYTSNTISRLEHKTVVFDEVVTNIGYGYNKYMGHFTCNVPGLYFFTWDIYVGGGVGYGVVTELVKNGSPMATAKAGTTDHLALTGSSSAVLQLNVGDAVWVRVAEQPNTNAVLYGRLTKFSGFLI